MRKSLYPIVYTCFVFVFLCAPEAAEAQQGATIRGKVTLQATGDPLRRANVLVSPLGRKAETGADGAYEITGLPPGKYEVVAHLHPLSDLRQAVEVAAGGVATVDFALAVAPIHEEITVTAAGREQMPLETFQPVASLELIDLAPRGTASLGEILDGELGVAKRSYGPGSSRPIIRGFDGDRVLIMQDGMPSGTLSSQSGDHGEPVDVSSVERVEIVRGPATLLYGTNAVGGVVNVITGHHQEHEHAHEGARGFLSGSGATNSARGGGSGGLEIGAGPWLFLGSGGGARSGDYATPLGTVANSGSELKTVTASLGRFSDRVFFRFNYGIQQGLYGIPERPADDDHHGASEAGHEQEGPVDLQWRRHNARLAAGINTRNPLIEKLAANLDYSNWRHRELAGSTIGTEFFNRQYSYRATFNQRSHRRLMGSFGLSGLYRSYRVRGKEQITPPVKQAGLAVFGIEEIPLDRLRLQLGGRIETNRYRPQRADRRAFTGFSGSVGVNAPLWRDGAVVASYSYSYRAPAIEELYNYGPHHGNLAFEIGNPRLGRERANGLELGLRHWAKRVHAEANYFYYRISDYVYLAPTGEFDHGLAVANFQQGDGRYVGGEALLHVELRPELWLNLAADAVQAQLQQTGIPLPRVPPVRGRIGLHAHKGNWSFQPEAVLVNRQDRLYVNESRTAGYAAASLTSDYTIATRRALHILALHIHNAGNRLYRNHSSLIKEYAPEAGRGVRFAYTVRFF